MATKKTKTVKHEKAPTGEAKQSTRIDHVAALPAVDTHPNARAKLNAERDAHAANALEDAKS